MAARALASAFVRIKPEFSTFKSETQKGVDEGTKGVGEKAGKTEGHSFGSAFSKFAAVGFVGVGAAGVVGLLAKSVADARNLGMVPLEGAVKRVGVAFSVFDPKLKAAQSRMEALGFTNSDVNEALTRMIVVTGNTGLSLKSLGTLADYARFKHIDLATASEALGKAAAGNSRALKELGITMPPLSTGTKKLSDAQKELRTEIAQSGSVAKFASDHNLSLATTQKLVKEASLGSADALKKLGISVGAAETPAGRLALVMAAMNKKIGGEAADAAGTFGGKLDILKARLTDASAKIGVALIPSLIQLVDLVSKYLVPALTKFGQWVLTVGIPMIKSWVKDGLAILGPVIKAIALYLADLARRFENLSKPAKIAVVAIVGLLVGVAIFKNLSEAVKAFGLAMKAAAVGNPWLILATVIAVVAILIITHWKTIQHWAEVCFNAVNGVVQAVWHWIKDHWPLLVEILTGPIGIATLFIIRHWNDIVNGLKTAFNTVVNFFKGLPGRMLNAIGNVKNLLTGIGGNLISGMLGGITLALRGIGGWIKKYIFNPIVNGIKSLFGIASPSTVMMGIGGHLVSGLIQGLIKNNPTKVISKVFGGLPQALGALVGKGLVSIEQLPSKALNALKSVGGGIGGFIEHLFGGGGGGGGVERWRKVVDTALGLLGEPLSLANQVLYQMGTESGGNPRAINLSDINAQMGDPSRGLLQVIGSTFKAYGASFLSHDIYDPLANVYAAINYAMHVYGRNLMSGGYGLGSGHGYALGGLITEPIVGVGASGQRYTFGEAGTETVIPGDVGSKLDAMISLLATLIGHTAAAPGATGAATAAALNGSARAAAYQGYYGVT